MEINQRKLQLKIGNLESDEVYTFNEDANISIRCKKTALSLQNVATITIDNIRQDLRNYLIGGFNEWDARNQKQPFVPVEFYIGRARATSYGAGSDGAHMRRIYVGSIHTTSMTQPPDVSVQMNCVSSLIDQNVAGTGFITQLIPRSGTFKDLFMLLGEMMNSVEPFYEATINPQVSASKFSQLLLQSYSLTGAVAFLAGLFPSEILIFIDDDKLYAVDKGAPLKGATVDITAESGMIGIPAITPWGVQFKTLADVPCRIGGAVNLISVMNPSVNGQYVITQAEYEVTSRETPFYTTWHASPPALEFVTR